MLATILCVAWVGNYADVGVAVWLRLKRLTHMAHLLLTISKVIGVVLLRVIFFHVVV